MAGSFPVRSARRGELIATRRSFRGDRGNDFFAFGVVLGSCGRSGAAGQQSCAVVRGRLWVASQQKKDSRCQNDFVNLVL